MKRLNRLVYVLTILLFGISLSHSADLKNNFLGIKWGTDIAELTDYVKISEKNGVSYYGNSKRVYTIFGVETPYVIFGFYKDKFFAAYIDIESIALFNRVKKHITQKFGSPRTILNVKVQQTIYRWKYEDTKIKLKLYEKEGKMKLGFYYTPIATKVNQAQREEFLQLPKVDIPPYNKELRLKEALDVMGF